MNQIDVALIDWSRAQFALTAMYHWLFVPLTLGLGLIICILETMYYQDGGRKMEENNQVLDETLWREFRYWGCNRSNP